MSTLEVLVLAGVLGIWAGLLILVAAAFRLQRTIFGLERTVERLRGDVDALAPRVAGLIEEIGRTSSEIGRTAAAARSLVEVVPRDGARIALTGLLRYLPAVVAAGRLIAPLVSRRRKR